MSVSSILNVRVASKKVEALDVCSIEFVSVDANPLPAFSAGSHIDVHLPGGIVRQYSLCNDSSETHRYQIAVLLDPESRGGSEAIHTLVELGQTLQISAPKNHFPLAHEAKYSLLLAGGIGITPLLCMAERLINSDQLFDLHYCARSAEHAAFLDRISAGDLAARSSFHFSSGEGANRLDLSALIECSNRDTHIYVCGPKRFMDAALGAARALDWPESQLHYEFFNAEVEKSDSDESFQVKLASSGEFVTVGKNQTVTQALSEAGVDIMVSCEQGVCGTCLTRVLEGVPDHKDSYLTPEEQQANDQFTPCCSRSKSAILILDI